MRVTYQGVQKNYYVWYLAEGETEVVNAYFEWEEPEEETQGLFDIDLRPVVVKFFGRTIEKAGYIIAFVDRSIDTYSSLPW